MSRPLLIRRINHCQYKLGDADTLCVDIRLFTNKTNRDALHLNKGLRQPLNVSPPLNLYILCRHNLDCSESLNFYFSTYAFDLYFYRKDRDANDKKI